MKTFILRFLVLLVSLPFLYGGCGSNGSNSTVGTAPTTTTTTTTTPTTTTTTTTTTTNGDGGSGVTVSTDATANMDLITSFTGSNSVTVSGTWTNESFASTGDVSVNISFDTSTNVVTIIWDIDGNVYGGSDPDPETFTIDMTDFISNGTATLTATSITYGDISVTLTYNTDGTGSFTGTAENEPTGDVENASFSGTFELDGGTVTFTVENSTFDYQGIPITCSNNVSATLN